MQRRMQRLQFFALNALFFKQSAHLRLRIEQFFVDRLFRFPRFRCFDLQGIAFERQSIVSFRRRIESNRQLAAIVLRFLQVLLQLEHARIQFGQLSRIQFRLLGSLRFRLREDTID